MRRLSPRSTDSGFSLPELIVSMVLVSFVLVALIALLREAVRFYNDQSVSLEVQKNVILAVQRIGNELRESSPLTVNQEPRSITFASPRDIDGQVLYEDGVLLWQRFTRFYVQDLDGASVLLRTVQPLAEPVPDPPSPAGLVFASASPTTIQARYIKDLRITMNEESAELEIEAAFGEDVFHMILNTEVKLQN